MMPLKLSLPWQLGGEVSCHILLYNSEVVSGRHFLALPANLCNFCLLADLQTTDAKDKVSPK